jgi:hypothetical protein
VLLGAAAGAVVLLPLSALGSVSDRSVALGWEWSTRLGYWPPNIVSFLLPYFHGDVSNGTYTGPSIFWEDYGYVGIATVLLAIYGAVRERRRPVVAFSIVMTLLAYLLVLGAETPVYRAVYLLVPGMKMFRFPTRFLFVVELGLALLGAIGLTRLRADLERRWKAPSRVPLLIVVAICAGTAADLFIIQPRQNPMVPARDWLAAPASVQAVHADSPQPRTYTPRYRDFHILTFGQARGWSDVKPYFDLRDTLAPNTGGGFWNTPSADCYAGIAARWFIDVWGDHNRADSWISQLAYLDFNTQTLRAAPVIARVLRTYGVSHVLSPYRQEGAALPFLSRAGNAYIYRVEGSARVRFVRAARHVTDLEAGRRLLGAGFDPDREILLTDAPDSVHPTVDELVDASSTTAAGRAVITHEDSQQVLIDADAPENGFLLLADTFYPGWTARVDDTPTPIYRANHSVRGIALPKGRHQVRFMFEAPGFLRGLTITVFSLSALLLWAVGAAYMDRKRVWR